MAPIKVEVENWQGYHMLDIVADYHWSGEYRRQTWHQPEEHPDLILDQLYWVKGGRKVPLGGKFAQEVEYRHCDALYDAATQADRDDY